MFSLTGEEKDVVSSEWNGFTKYEFAFRGHRAILVSPKNSEELSTESGKRWIWRTEFFGAFPYADIEMVRRGYYLVYLGISDLYGSDESVSYMKEFYDYLIWSQNFCIKTILVGFSRGGLYARRFAAKYPEAAAALYLDAPVVDVLSWPGGRGKGPGGEKEWKECVKCYGYEEKEMDAVYSDVLKQELADFAGLKIPMILVAGAADELVPYEENGKLLENLYQQNGAPFQVILKPGIGHHPHSLEEPFQIVNFLCRYA